jgi:hypothetical protein
MTATYSLSKAELNADFIESIKNTFKSERISICIEEEVDETERILENKALYDKIMQASEEANKKKNIVRFEENEFMEKFGSI